MMGGAVNLMLGDCLDRMAEIPNGAVDLVLVDPPYGTTACKWDSVIPFEPMWAHVWRLVKPNSAAVFTASQPFTSALVMSQPSRFKHAWVWNKRFAANFSQARYHPLKTHEDVLTFSAGTVRYYPQKTPRDKPIKIGKNAAKSGSSNLATAKREFDGKVYTDKNPETVLAYSNRAEGQKRLHPTQKPVALMEYLIRTYSQEGETVLDFTMGSGTTGVACANTGRKFIGIEREPEYFEIAKGRITEAYGMADDKTYEVFG